MKTESCYRSKIPVGWVLLLLANILLVMALEVLLLYQAPVPLSAEDLSKADPRFDGAVLSQSQKQGYLHCALAETPDGQVYLVPVRVHGIVFTRGRILNKQIVAVADNADTTVNVKVGIHTSTLSVSPEPPPWLEDPAPEDLYLTIVHSSSAAGSSMAVLYLLMGGILTFLELAVVQLLKGN